MTVSKSELIREFSRAVREGTSAVFAGAGLSRPSGYVSWKGLVAPLAESLGLDVERESDLATVAQFYRNERGGRGYVNQAIVNAFDRGTGPNENVRIVTRLPVRTYWTTNYDRLIEDGLDEAGRVADVKVDPEELAYSRPGREAVVYKMHGCVSRPSHAVLTKDDYDGYASERGLFRAALLGDLVSKTFLFVGFGFGDPNLDFVLSQLHSLLGEAVREHYCIVRSVRREDCGSEEAYRSDLARQGLQERNLRRYGVQTCFVDDFSEVTEILRDIERSVRSWEVLVSGSAAEYGSPWDGDSAASLAAGLGSALVGAGCRVTSGYGLGIGSSVISGALCADAPEKGTGLDGRLRLRPFPQGISDPGERSRLWSEYRREMVAGVGVAVFVFGNKWSEAEGRAVVADGCLEEFRLAREAGCAVIPIGSTGYAAQAIYDEVRSDMGSYPYLVDCIDVLGAETDAGMLVDTVLEIVKNLQGR